MCRGVRVDILDKGWSNQLRRNKEDQKKIHGYSKEGHAAV